MPPRESNQCKKSEETNKAKPSNNKAISYNSASKTENELDFRTAESGYFLYSRIPPVDWTFFDWNLLVLLPIVSRVDFIVFVLFLEALRVRECCCTAVEIGWQLCASRLFREQRLDEPSSQRVGGFGLSQKPPKLRSWSCPQPRAAKATAGAAIVGSMGSMPRAAAVV